MSPDDARATDVAAIGAEPDARSVSQPTRDAGLATRIEALETRVKRAVSSSAMIAVVAALLGSGGAVGLAQYLDGRALRAIEVRLKEQEMRLKTHEAVVDALKKSIDHAEVDGHPQQAKELRDLLKDEMGRFIKVHRLESKADK